MGLSRPPAPARLRISQIITIFVVAKEQGREASRPYVWDATNISAMHRHRQWRMKDLYTAGKCILLPPAPSFWFGLKNFTKI